MPTISQVVPATSRKPTRSQLREACSCLRRGLGWYTSSTEDSTNSAIAIAAAWLVLIWTPLPASIANTG